MTNERANLASQLVRAQAMLWSSEDPVVKQRLRKMIADIEARLAAQQLEHSLPTRLANSVKADTARS